MPPSFISGGTQARGESSSWPRTHCKPPSPGLPPSTRQNPILLGPGSGVPALPSQQGEDGREKTATPEPSLALLKEAPASGMVPALCFSAPLSKHPGGLCHWCLDKKVFNMEESPLIFHRCVQNKAARTAQGLRCCRSKGSRQMECSCSHPVLCRAPWSQVSFVWP